VHVYVINEEIGSLFSLISKDGSRFDRGYAEDFLSLLKKGQLFKIRVYAYKNGEEYITERDLIQSPNIVLEMTPYPVLSTEGLEPLRLKGRVNSIKVDLKYQDVFYQEKQWERRLVEEQLFMNGLFLKATPCEPDLVRGKELFKTECKACHALHKEIVGPALGGITSKRSLPWLLTFTAYPEWVIKSGDSTSVELYNTYQQYMPNYNHLSNKDIMAIYHYIESME
jgi:mono/diheme cytochrome c family protein